MTADVIIRLSFFVGIIAAMAFWESGAPTRPPRHSRARRRTANLGVMAVYTLIVRLAFPVLPVGMAIIAQQRGWGLFNNSVTPGWLAAIVCFILLDMIIYLQHVLFHAVPAFWKLHMMHHADLDFDFTTGIRFHPVEIVLSTIIKLGSVVALGAPPGAVVLFEIVLNGMAMFNHGNVSLPPKLDKMLRLFVVTPDMHRVHHSVIIREANANFGFNLPWWDRLMGTYRDQPARGHKGMTIGLSHIRDPKYLSLGPMIMMPMKEDTGAYPLGLAAREPTVDSKSGK